MTSLSPRMSAGAATHVGRVRQRNEDALFVGEGIYVVADGMGGHDGGDVASRIVVEEAAKLADEKSDAGTSGLSHVTAEHLVVQLVARAATRLQQYGRNHPAPPGMGAPGTTLVMAFDLTQEQRWLIANVGDSRAYHFDASGVLTQISQDHSVVGDLVARGLLTPAAAAHHPERHVITRAISARPIGFEQTPRPDFFSVPWEGRLLLCSDGVNEMLSDAELTDLLAMGLSASDTAQQIVEAAVKAGGVDNATAVVVEVGP